VILRCLVALAVFAVLALASAQFWIILFVYRPAPLASLDPASSGLHGVAAMTVRYPDGASVTGWWRPPLKPDRPVVLIVHGRSGNIASRAPILRRLAADEFGVLVFDYRGYGASQGHPNEGALSEDTLTAYRWLRAKGIEARRIVVVGQSLGNSPAARLAAREPVGGLILVSPYTDLPDAIGERLPWLPIRILPWTRNRFEVGRSLARFSGPTLLVASRHDGLVPIENTEKLRALAPRSGWLDVSPLRHDGMLAAIAADGRLTRAIRSMTAPANLDPRVRGDESGYASLTSR
jgi:pimeloyl-ACP methyl ester carboxylesterase